jgi:hypothetical protein
LRELCMLTNNIPISAVTLFTLLRAMVLMALIEVPQTGICMGQPASGEGSLIRKYAVSVESGLKWRQGTGFDIRAGFGFRVSDRITILPTVGIFTNINTMQTLNGDIDTILQYIPECGVRVQFVGPGVYFGTLKVNSIGELMAGTIAGMGVFFSVGVTPQLWIDLGTTASYNYLVNQTGIILSIPTLGVGIQF